MANAGASAGWGLVVAVSLLLGALAAARVELPERAAAVLSALGGGLLLAAVALELVPEADREGGALLTTAGLLAGTLAYVAADEWLTRDDTMKAVRRAGHAAAAGRPMVMPAHAQAARGEAIAAGLFIDGVPESLALGLTIAEGSLGGALLVGIVVGNVVEAYGAAQPIIAGGHSRRFAVGLLAGIGVSLGCATLLGGTTLSEATPAFVGTAQAVAAGAVLAVISISIVPHAFEEVSSVVAVAAVAGFIAGYLLS
jgi:zinc transporter, ZIP family